MYLYGPTLEMDEHQKRIQELAYLADLTITMDRLTLDRWSRASLVVVCVFEVDAIFDAELMALGLTRPSNDSQIVLALGGIRKLDE